MKYKTGNRVIIRTGFANAGKQGRVLADENSGWVLIYLDTVGRITLPACMLDPSLKTLCDDAGLTESQRLCISRQHVQQLYATHVAERDA